ncbi:hypothetical protein C8R45DRAFT_926562 [Mycena sanguinolenta]|nr:hypothetical protein C8R45DRAFT_926562 [Mycena sanguinolenta]
MPTSTSTRTTQQTIGSSVTRRGVEQAGSTFRLSLGELSSESGRRDRTLAAGLQFYDATRTGSDPSPTRRDFDATSTSTRLRLRPTGRSRGLKGEFCDSLKWNTQTLQASRTQPCSDEIGLALEFRTQEIADGHGYTALYGLARGAVLQAIQEFKSGITSNLDAPLILGSLGRRFGWQSGNLELRELEGRDSDLITLDSKTVGPFNFHSRLTVTLRKHDVQKILSYRSFSEEIFRRLKSRKSQRSSFPTTTFLSHAGLVFSVGFGRLIRQGSNTRTRRAGITPHNAAVWTGPWRQEQKTETRRTHLSQPEYPNIVEQIPARRR